MDIQTQQFIQQEVQRQLKDRDRVNASGILFDPNTGLHTQGKNLVGITGDRAIHNVIRTNLTEQTIASGVINFTSSDIAIFTESSASSDDLDTINPINLAQGNDLLILRAADDGDTVVVKNGTGNIQCQGDFSLDDIDDRIVLQWDRINSRWVELFRSDSNGTGWTTWSPTLKKNDKTTALTGTINFAAYLHKSDYIIARFNASAISDPSGNTIYFSLPVSSASESANIVVGSGFIANGGIGDMGYAYIESSEQTYVAVDVRGGGVWGAADNSINMTIIYRPA